MKRKDFTVIAYLDDCLLIEDSYERCLESFNTLIDLLQTLGFPINWGKVVYPCQRLIFLGIEIDTILRRLTLPKQKIVEIRDILQLRIRKNKLTKRELQSIIRKLNFAYRVIYGGGTFLRWIIDFCNTVTKPNHRIRLNSGAKADLYWWINYMEIFNGFIEIIDRSPLPQHIFWTDACPTGGGGGGGGAQFRSRLPTLFRFAHKQTPNFYGVSRHSKVEGTIPKQMGHNIRRQFMYTNMD